MSKKIVILGTKGVGKTTFFKRLTNKYALEKGKKVSPIVNYSEEKIKIKNQIYHLIDTPPFVVSPKTEIEKVRKDQMNELLTQSDLICWIVNQIDEIALVLNRILRKYSAPRILVFNQTAKLDSEEESFENKRFFGLDYHFLVSVLTERDLEKLIIKITELLPDSEKEEQSIDKKTNLLIFGPTNSGKSTLMNHLLQKNRSLVSPFAGTTQEPVISQWSLKLFKEKVNFLSRVEEINFQLVDTAGITKQETVSRSWWRKCELSWAVVDATALLTKQILQIVNLGEKFSKPLVIIINKSDLIFNPLEQTKIETELRKRLKSLSYVPLVFISAKTGKNVPLLLKISAKILQKAQQKFGKKELDTQIQKIIAKNPPPSFSGHRLKVYFVKHRADSAHYFIFFVNNPHWIHFAYQRYLVNQIRKNLGLEHLPIRIIFRKSD
ncbi:MAG: GTP-binding protein EngA [Mycoplasmataceae bacterium RC_NB112A]|nr:MAG: GTP-binding protein EngA [Mycoplasmataceae bacterium RC_NB112A]